MTEGQKLEKYSVNLYIKGKSFPEPARLDAMCKALGLNSEALMSESEGPGVWNKPNLRTLEATDAGDGKMWLTVNKRLRLPTVLKIMQMIHEDDEDGKSA